MLNGIRLNSFNKINDTLKTNISSSENLEFIYDSLYEFELQYIYNTSSFKWRNLKDIEPINFRNILETITIVFEKSNSSVFYSSYIVYDKDDFDTYSEQNELLSKVLINKYLDKFDRYNRKTEINRNLIFELDVYVNDNNVLKPALQKLEEIKDIDELDYTNLLNALKRDLRTFILYYGQNTLNQFWILFVEPDKYNSIDAYIQIINAIYQYQFKVVQYSQSLIGPNTSVYTSDNTFINTCIQEGVIDKFNHLCFTSEATSNISKDVFNYANNKQIYFTKQIYNKDYLINELDLMKNKIYCILNNLFPELINYDLTQDLTLQRVYNHGLKYNILFNNTDVSIGNCDQITFYDNEQIDKLYILYGNENIIVTPHYARTLYLKDGEFNLLTDREVDLLDNDYYAIITEDNTLSITDLSILQNKIKETLLSYKQTILHMNNMLASSYNKEIIDTNFYKLLRSIAYLLSNYKYDLQEVKNSMYLNELDKTITNDVYKHQVQGESIYNNFGAIIDLPKKDRWTYEQYRNVVTAVYNACLLGPTKVNIEEAITTFTSYDSVIYELYKDGSNPIFENINELDKTYRYAVEIHKALDKYDNADELYNDIVYLLTIIKPAQALFLIYITFNETELYEVISQVQDTGEFINIIDTTDNFHYLLDEIFKTTDKQKRSYIIGNLNIDQPIDTSEFVYNKLDLDESGYPYTYTEYDPETDTDVVKIDFTRNTKTTIQQDPIYLRRIGVKRIRTFDYPPVMEMSITQVQYNNLTEEEKEFYKKQGITFIIR